MKMNMAQKVLLIIGGAFAGIGAVLTMIFGSIGMVFRPMRAFLALPLFFLILGICFIAAVLFGQHKKSLIVKNGIRYAAKIYGYVENTAYMVNGRFPVNVIVHYFDKNQIEREAVIPTAFEKGASTYPIGMTMDIYEYQGKYGWDPDSVRDEILPEYGSWDAYVWSFTGGRTVYEPPGIVTNQYSDAMAEDLKRRGARYAGSVSIFSYLQAVGVINSHSKECFCYKELEEQGSPAELKARDSIYKPMMDMQILSEQWKY